MAQKTVKRKFNLNIDEEKDIFLSSLNKKIRNARKKLDQIEELEKKGKDNLKKEQLDKINSRGESLEVIRYNESIKDLYYQALKAAQDEGKALPQQETQARNEAEEDKTEQAAQPTKVEEPVAEAPVSTQDNSRIITETLSKVLNLVHFAQLFRAQSNAQGFRQALDSRRGEVGVDSLPDFESFNEFFVKVFTLSESDRFGNVGDKIDRSLEELESYINGSDEPALRNKTYSHLQNIVESVAGASFFRSHNVEVEAPKARTVTEPSAIGSELRKQEPQETPVVQQQERRSPEKEVRSQPAPTRSAEKPAQQEEARRDWGTLEDEEEEQQEENVEAERVVEEEQTTTENKQEEKKADDGFISVKPKYKEKKEETGYRGSGTRPYRGGRGGERGGYRKPREGQEGQEGGYRPRPRRDDQQEGGEAGEGQRGERGGYRGNRGERGGYRGNRGERGGYRGQGRGGRNYGERREEQGQGERTTGTEAVRQENA